MSGFEKLVAGGFVILVFFVIAPGFIALTNEVTGWIDALGVTGYAKVFIHFAPVFILLLPGVIVVRLFWRRHREESND